MRPSAIEECILTRREVVIGDNRVIGRQQAIDEVASNETGPAGYECAHRPLKQLPSGLSLVVSV
jgi:hypothetical protein